MSFRDSNGFARNDQVQCHYPVWPNYETAMDHRRAPCTRCKRSRVNQRCVRQLAIIRLDFLPAWFLIGRSGRSAYHVESYRSDIDWLTYRHLSPPPQIFVKLGTAIDRDQPGNSQSRVFANRSRDKRLYRIDWGRRTVERKLATCCDPSTFTQNGYASLPLSFPSRSNRNCVPTLLWGP